MAILKRTNKYQGLKDIDVLVEESGLSSQYFNIYDVPSNIPQGRSSFLLAGSPFLKNFVELKVEILDSAGQTVYTEPVSNYIEGNARRVSIEVYDDTAPGDAFLYIVGELKDNFRSVSGQQRQNLEVTDKFLDSEILNNLGGNDVPHDFQNIYNVRYIRPIFINTVIPNSEPIYFYQQPRVTVTEILKGYVVETSVSSSYEITGSVSVDPIPDLKPKDPEPDPIDGFSKGMNDGARDEIGNELEIFKNRRSSKIDPLRHSNYSSRGRVMRRESPEIDRFTITVGSMETSPENTTSDAVTSAFVGGEITINNPSVDSTLYPPDEYTIPTQYKSSIKKVNNEKTLVPLDDFVITKKSTGEKVPVQIDEANNNVTMSVTPTPPQIISTTHYRSYADIIVGNLHTFSGDVYKAKIYARSKGTLGDFEPVYDASIEAPQVLIDSYSETGFKNTGYFYTQSIVDDYWDVVNGTATQNNSKFIDGVLISGSNAGFTPEHSTVNTVEFNTSHSYDLQTGVPYTLEFNAYYYKEDKSDKDGVSTKQAELEVFLSGSAMTGGSEENHKLGKVVVNDNTTEGQVLGVHNTFTSAITGTPSTHLKFKATSGRWIIQDILLRPHSETNFNPSYFRTIVPMTHPLPKKPDQYDFLVEFYDLNNNIAETISVKENIDFVGAPQNIDGEDNLLSGSLFIGNAQGSGFEMAGASSAYMRSLTYEGFDKTIASSSGGFMIWSGSVGGRLSSSEDYDGVGLEIVDAHGATDRYLKFRTNPSTFQVVTDDFFLGQTDSTFVSGSNGNLHISSSNFEVQPDGDVIMSGTITATAGNIGDWTISGGDIVGANITMDADSSRIYKTDDNADLTGYYMDFTPGSNYYIRFGTNFAVSSSGTLIAEGAIIEGVLTSSEGLIANWTIDSDSIYKLTSGKYSGLSSTGDTRFFGGASSLTATGSAPFNVKATGDITGSSVLFTGGKIANFTIDGHSLTTTGVEINDSTQTLFISSSAFKVKHDGEVSGSDVLFTGGKVGGFEIVSDGLSSVNDSFQVTGSTGQVSGSQVYFDGGKIGGFVLTSTELYSLDSGTPDSTPDTGITIDTTGGGNSKGVIRIYDGTTVNAALGNWTSGKYGIYAQEGLIGGWTVTSTELYNLASGTPDSSPDTGMTIDTTGGSNSAAVVRVYDGTTVNAALGNWASGKYGVYAIEGDIGGWVIDSNSIYKNNIVLSSNNSIISIGGTTFGSAGIQLQYADSQGKFYAGDGSNNHIRYNETGVDIKTAKFELDTPTLDISSTNRRITISDTDGSTEYVRIGEVSTDASDKYGIKVWDGTGTNDTTDLIAMFGEQGNKIAGWEITGTQIRTIPTAGLGGLFAEGENGLIIHSSGRLESADFATNLKGWRIDTLGNGTAEFENARIRGTLRTAVFEKESVNVVGGQLMVANATTLEPLRSGSVILAGNSGSSATDVTMSMANISGFVKDEIIKAKRVGQTGFSVEYLQVTGSKRYSTDPALAHITGSQIDPDGLAGELYVGRGYGTITNISSSIGTLDGNISNPAKYSTSQSIVLDLGSNTVNVQDVIKIGTEKFKIISGSVTGNTGADQTVEVLRDFHNTDTGSHSDGATVFKINGDNEFLQGLVSTAVSYNEGQVFVSTGKYDASADLSSGYILMNANPNDISTPYMDIVERTGSGVYDLQLRTRLGDLSGLSSAYLYGDEEPGFGLYTENGFFRGTLHAMTGSIHGILNVATQQGGIETGQKITIGRGVDGTHDGFRINNNNYWFTTGEFRAGDATNYFHVSGTEANIASNISIKTDDFNIDTSTFDVSTDNGGKVALGTLTGVNPSTTNRGLFASGSGEVLIKGGTDSGKDYLLFNSSGMTISVDDIDITATEFDLSSTGLKIDNDHIHLGTITTDTDVTGAGFYASSSGVFRVQGDADNYLRISAGAMDIKSETFNLDATTVVIDSATNSGKIALGASPNSSIAGTGKGVYMDGTGDFLLYGSATNLFKFDAAGTAITMKSDTFSLTGTNLELSNTKFKMGTVADATTTATTNSGFYVDSSGNFLVKGNTSGANYFKVTAGGAIDVNATTFNLTANTNDLIIDSAGHYISLADGNITLDGTSTGFFEIGGLTSTAASQTAKGVYFEGDGDFIIKSNTTANENYIQGVGGDLIIKADDIDITSTTFDLNAGSGKLVIGSSTPSIALTTADATFSVGSITSDSDTTGAGVFMDGNGHFRVIGDADNQIIVDGGDMTIKSQDLTLLSTYFTASSDHGGYISLPTTASNAGYPGDDTWTTQNGVWLSGSGEFNLKQDGSRYIRHIKGQGIEMAFPNFSVDSDGNMTANSASFMGDIQAKSGFFGQSTGSGWVIDGATIRDDDSQIVIDGTSTSPSITIVSQSFSAEMVPDFTPGSVILAGGGLAYNSGVQGIDSSPEDTQTGTITNGNNFATANTVFQGFTAVTGGTSSPMTGSTAYGGMNGGDLTGEATAASLTGPDRVYKSSVSLEHKTTVSSNDINDSGINNWMTLGGASYTLILKLRKTNGTPSTVYEETISGVYFTDFMGESFTSAGTGPYTHEMVKSFTRTVNHTVETNMDTFQWEISAANTTNDNLRGTYTNSNIGNKPGTEYLTLTSCTTGITAASHAPSNKKVEIAPSGFQAVFLQESTLEHEDNSYFRVTPAEDKTVDILGSAVVTGSLKIKEIGSTDYVTIDPNAADGIATNKDILAENIQGTRIEVGDTTNYFVNATTGTNGILVTTAGTPDFLFADSGDFHAGRDIIGYSADSNVSDIKFKENILPIHDALFKVKQLRGVEFDWKKSFNDNGHDIGFVAQEVEKIDGLGVLVKDKKNFKTEEDMKTLSYTKVVPLLVEAIKEQQIQIEELQSKLEKLDGSIG
jgi:hypothetical protein